MNIQSHHSGQISGQVLNQAGNSLSGLQQQNGNPVPGQMQNPNIHRSVSNMDPEIVKRRRQMQEKIWEFLMHRRQQSHEVPTKKMIDLVKRLEEGLFKSAATKEEYLNLGTLESRLHVMIRRLPMTNHNQQFQHTNSSPSIGTMIPTPGFQQPGNTSLVGSSSLDSTLAANNSSNTITSSTVNSGSYLPTGNGSAGTLEGALASGYQHSSAYSVNSGGNNMVASMGEQRMTSQMIPTPGFNNPNNNEVNNNSNQSFMNVESSNNVRAFTAVESTTASQPMQQKQHVVGQNSRILHNLSGPMSGGIRSTLQQKSYGLPNGQSNGGLGMMGNNTSVVNGPGTTEGYLTGTVYGSSTKPMHQHFGQHQRPVQGDGYGIAQADTSGSGNLYAPVTSVGSMMNNQSLNASTQSIPKTESGSMINQSTPHSIQQVTTMKPQLVDQSDKLNFQSRNPLKENFVQPHQPPPFQQPPHQFQRQQVIHHQAQQKQQIQNQFLLKNDSFSQAQISRNVVSEAKSGPGVDHRLEGLQSQVSDPFQFSEIQSQVQQTSMIDSSRMLSHSSGPHDVCSSPAQNSDQMQQSLHSQKFASNCQNDFGGLSGGTQMHAAFNDQWYSKPQDVSHLSGRPEQTVQDEFQHRLTGQGAAQLNNLSSEESVIGQSDACRSAEPPNLSNSVSRSNNLNRERQFKNQQRWLLFLRHARRCPSPEGKCPEPNCLTAQKLLSHMESCSDCQCPYPRCRVTRALLTHHRRCRDTTCPVCVCVKNFVQAQVKAFARPDHNAGVPGSANGSCKIYDSAEIAGKSAQNTSSAIAESPEDLQPSIKRIKVEQGIHSLASETESSVAAISAVNNPHLQGANLEFQRNLESLK